MFTWDTGVWVPLGSLLLREMHISVTVPGRKTSEWNNDLQTLLPGNKQIPLRQRKIKLPVATFHRLPVHGSIRAEL